MSAYMIYGNANYMTDANPFPLSFWYKRFIDVKFLTSIPCL